MCARGISRASLRERRMGTLQRGIPRGRIIYFYNYGYGGIDRGELGIPWCDAGSRHHISRVSRGRELRARRRVDALHEV